MFRNILKQLNIALMGVVLLAGGLFVACDNDDDTSVTLSAFGPNPVLRGNDIKFIGENLDKVTSVVLPSDIEVTDITVLSGSEISITVPQNAEAGTVQLKYDGGSVNSKSQLSFSEPYEITSLAPLTAVRAGDTVTINGDYLNNIVKVTFNSGAVVDSAGMVEQSREVIKVLLPKAAQTGKLFIEDAEGNQLYSDGEIVVTQPLISGLSTTEIKAGEELTISGADLDLVTAVTFAGGTKVEALEFLSHDASSIQLATPENLQDGKVVITSFAGIDAESSDELIATIPSELEHSVGTVYKAGENLVIKGKDLDLVTAVSFANAEASSFEYNEADSSITVSIPAEAIDGVITLTTASIKTVETESVTLVKPTVTSLSPNPVMATGTLTLAGTDLDLVTSVTFADGSVVEVTTETATELSVIVPLEATNGKLTLTLANGTTLETDELTIDSPTFCFIPVLPSENDTVFAGEMFSFEVVNADVLTEVQVGGNVSQFIIQGDLLHVLMPNNVGGQTELKLISSTGEIAYTIAIIGSGPVEKTICEGPVSLAWGDGGRAFVPASGFADLPAGSVMKIYFAQTENWGQAQINNGAWTVIPFAELGDDGYLKTDTYHDKSVTMQELILTQEILDNIAANADESGNGIIIQGAEWIIAKVTVTPPVEVNIFQGPVTLTWDDGGRVMVPVAPFVGLPAGTKMKIYFTQTEAWGQAQINNGAWAPIEGIGDAGYLKTDTYHDKTVTEQEVVLTQELIDNIVNNADDSGNGIIIQGAEWIIDAIVLL